MSAVEKRNVSAPTTAPPSSRCVASSSPGFDPERQGHVQIARRAPQQEVDQLHRAARQAVDLVEHEQARPLVTLDCAGQHSHLLHRRRRDPSVVRAQKIGIQSRVLERVRQIAAEQVGRIVVVQRDPGDDYPPAPSCAGPHPPAPSSCRIRRVPATPSAAVPAPHRGAAATMHG